MYPFLTRFLPPRIAGLLTAGWYAVLVLLVLYYIMLPNGQFRYAHW